jgi:hypothetical protein
MLKRFIGVWLIYWTVILLLPIRSIYPATAQAFILQLGFVLITSLSYLAVNFILNPREIQPVSFINISRARTLIKLSLTLSLIGLVFLMYDKIYIQGVNYADGLAVAREQWRELGEDRDGEASSIFSILGYLFGSSYYIAALLAITQIKLLNSAERIKFLLFSFFFVMVNSAVTGGRSSILLFASFVFSAMAAHSKIRFRNIFESQKQRWLVIISVAMAFGYTIIIFFQRADASDLKSIEYLLDFLPFLGLESFEWFSDILDDGILSSLSSMFLLSVSYLTHSFATTSAIIDAPAEDSILIFNHIINIFGKIGLAEQSNDEWFLSGRFPSLPGALWHQFGGVGLVMSSFALGAASAIAYACTTIRPARILSLGIFVMIDVVLVLSPFLFAGDLLSFPFVLIAFVLFAVVEMACKKDFF